VRLEQSFEVAAPLERVWSALVDVERVAPCLPGAAVTARKDDGSYTGTFTIKIGPATATYAGKLEMQEVDEAAHSARMHASGTDKRGQGGAKATIFSTVSAVGDERTRVDVATDYHITGRLAGFSRGGMIQDIGEKVLREFAGRLRESLEGSGGGEGAGTAVAVRGTEGAGAAEAVRGAEGAGTAEAVRGTEGAGAAQAVRGTERPAGLRPEPLHGATLVSSVLRERWRRNPAPLAVLVGVLVAVLVFRRRRG
jgi:uncharacterized protein